MESVTSEFIFLGFPTALKEVQILLFLIFLLIYMLTLVENVVIIVTVRVSYPLHKPMYLFLSSLSFLEIWYITVTVPKILLDLLRGSQHISFLGCMAQLYFFIALACTKCVLLAVMAYDYYVAICIPLRYSAIMTHGLCFCLVAGSWVSGFTSSMLKVVFISRLTFCGSVINHFFCDISPLLNLALATVARIPMTQGRWKAFSTCTSHLVVVIIFYSTIFFTYARPRAMYAFDSRKLVSMLYTVIVPFFNPIIYCLRSQDVKKALRKIVRESTMILGKLCKD
uniref:G-protein coupled receptors family 1 profile domain-containing protein n=1 Tax=Chelonoidis abingdonii TaxID=106734 RepID=A0A8C0J158_CHEAB